LSIQRGSFPDKSPVIALTSIPLIPCSDAIDVPNYIWLAH
jgi:hypothetical protein